MFFLGVINIFVFPSTIGKKEKWRNCKYYEQLCNEESGTN